MLRVENITKKYGNFTAVNNISFTLKKGDITGFLGPNGAGKTTTMRIITNFLSQDTGKVTYDNMSINIHFDKIISNIGYLPENNPLYGNLRVDETLVFTARLKGVKDKNKINEIASKCGIKNVLTKEIDNLSKGYKQRVGLAKALIGDPQYLILDEPTEGLDPNQKEEILELIKSFSKDKAIIFSSHVLSEVTKIANKIIIINKGKIVASGEKDTLLKEHFKQSKVEVLTDAPQLKFIKLVKNVKGVTNIEKGNKGRKNFKEYIIDCNNPEKVSYEIFEIVVKNKWKLTKLNTTSYGLDELFRELTK